MMELTVTQLQQPGHVLRIRANWTAHWYQIGDYVITVGENPSTPWTGDLKMRYGEVISMGRPTGTQFVCLTDVEYCGYMGPIPNFSLNRALEGLAQFHQQKPKQSPVTLTTVPSLAHVVPRTQKARGLQSLGRLGLLNTKDIHLIRTPVSKTQAKTISFPVMARPCPVKPRHGFVDSRIVKNYRALNRLLEQTLEADAHGEVILMEPIKAAFSAVVTDSAVTIGRGTSGATSGKGAYSLSCHSNLHAALFREVTEFRITPPAKYYPVTVNATRYAGLRPNTGIFVETVGDQIVQLRTGPVADYSQMRYCANETGIVTGVTRLGLDPNFLAYERTLDDLKAHTADPSTMVVHLPGSSLASHWAVQAITRGFSVSVEASPPELGTRFSTGMGNTPVVWGERAARTLHAAIQIGSQATIDEASLRWAASVIQGMGGARRTVSSTACIVSAGMILLRAGTGICLGEYRHFYRKGPGRAGQIPLTLLDKALPEIDPFPGDYTYRAYVYRQAFKLVWNEDTALWHKMLGLLHTTAIDFNQHQGWVGSFGGAKWGECTQATMELLTAMMPFATNKFPVLGYGAVKAIRLEGAVLHVIGAANKLITLSHNNGKCLTKIVSVQDLALISHGTAGLNIAQSPLTWQICHGGTHAIPKTVS